MHARGRGRPRPGTRRLGHRRRAARTLSASSRHRTTSRTAATSHRRRGASRTFRRPRHARERWSRRSCGSLSRGPTGQTRFACSPRSPPTTRTSPEPSPSTKKRSSTSTTRSSRRTSRTALPTLCSSSWDITAGAHAHRALEIVEACGIDTRMSRPLATCAMVDFSSVSAWIGTRSSERSRWKIPRPSCPCRPDRARSPRSSSSTPAITARRAPG